MPDLYAVVFTTAPIILITISGSVVFGPVPDRARHVRRSRRWEAWSDGAGIVLIFIGALVSLLVLAGVIEDTAGQRMAAASGAGLALLLAAVHVSVDVRLRYTEKDSLQRGTEEPPAAGT
ncbi:hypothetical protein ICW40_18130 [Actinotalea ferrariae]|uniref:hypothetical protein n=1 Tax=Actinotalea ferrariae TaxID=1386098 RepID=UPI001C8BA0F6|nr:hypothetical protein [Actinotalea ferrariae]MBX9246711.1 hypothetical protein [Actinotalea ferrariae]